MPTDNNDNTYRSYNGYGRGQNRDSYRRGGHDHRKNRKPHNSYQNRSSYHEKEQAIVSPKLDAPICAYCGEAILDLPAALADRQTGNPVHFDCVLKKLNESETLKQNEKIVYIGQGRFAVAYFDNPHDLRKFSIIRIIEWEEKDKKFEWRSSIAGLYSQVK